MIIDAVSANNVMIVDVLISNLLFVYIINYQHKTSVLHKNAMLASRVSMLIGPWDSIFMSIIENVLMICVIQYYI